MKWIKNIFHFISEHIIKRLYQRINKLEYEKKQLLLRVFQLEGQVKTLKNQLSKDSHNSSKPPSCDGFKKKTKPLRNQSGKKVGGQTGHSGSTLTLSDKPDKTIRYKVSECTHCGHSLQGVDYSSIERRQVFDIPPIQIEITEHQSEKVQCPHCGKMNKALFPDDVSNVVQYGKQIQAMVINLSCYQLIPYKRISEFLNDLLEKQISVGTIVSMVKKYGDMLESNYTKIKEMLKNSPTINNDESGLYVAKTRKWIHVVSTEKLTYYSVHNKRGQEAMDAIGILPEYQGRCIHDFWKPYLSYSCLHGLCNAHHLRELTYLHEQYNSSWAIQMKKLLIEINEAVKTRKQSGHINLENHLIMQFENQYEQIIKRGEIETPENTDTKPPGRRGKRKQSEPYNLLSRLKNYQSAVLAFMYDFNVPFDNNIAERDIRMIKVQQKISGCFRKIENAQTFCKIRGYISTARKNEINAFKAIKDALSGNPYTPNIS